jgi:hypothetical protein
MRYLLVMHMDPTAWESLSEAQRQAVYSGHEQLQAATRATGELVRTEALGDPGQSRVVRVRNGDVAETDGPFQAGPSFVCGYYVVDCTTPERAAELAAQVPEASFSAIEVRPIVFASGDR